MGPRPRPQEDTWSWLNDSARRAALTRLSGQSETSKILRNRLLETMGHRGPSAGSGHLAQLVPQPNPDIQGDGGEVGTFGGRHSEALSPLRPGPGQRPACLPLTAVFPVYLQAVPSALSFGGPWFFWLQVCMAVKVLLHSLPWPIYPTSCPHLLFLLQPH